jgi:hypothetical protein
MSRSKGKLIRGIIGWVAFAAAYDLVIAVLEMLQASPGPISLMVPFGLIVVNGLVIAIIWFDASSLAEAIDEERRLLEQVANSLREAARDCRAKE